MVNLSKEELQAVAECIQTAWQNGVVKSPVFAHHLISASQKLGQEFDAMAPDEPVPSPAMPAEEVKPAKEMAAKKTVPVDMAV